MSRPYAFVKVVSAGMYLPDSPDKGTLGRIVLDLKDHRDDFPAVIEAMNHVFFDELRGIHFDRIVPIPTHTNEEGPVFKVCKYLGELFDIPILDVIRFEKGMRSSKDLTGDEKFDNAKGRIHILNRESIGSSSILLVDDIVTTCGTSHWCSKELLGKGARSVHVLSVCRNIRKSHLDFIGYTGRY